MKHFIFVIWAVTLILMTMFAVYGKHADECHAHILPIEECSR